MTSVFKALRTEAQALDGAADAPGWLVSTALFVFGGLQILQAACQGHHCRNILCISSP